MANRTNDCGGVCAEIRERLAKLNLIGPQEVRHRPVYDALDKVVLVSKEDLEALASALPEVRVSWMKKYF